MTLSKSTQINVTVGFAILVVTAIVGLAVRWSQMEEDVRTVRVYIRDDRAYRDVISWVLFVLEKEHGQVIPPHILVKLEGGPNG